MEHVVLVGRYPPPFGGNSVHIQRLAQRLVLEGCRITVVDPYSSSREAREPSWEPFTLVDRRPGILGLVLFAIRVARLTNGATVHFHVSAGGRFYSVACALLLATAKAKRRLITLHSGSWVPEFNALTRARQRRVLGTLRAFDCVICVNPLQESVLKEHLRGRVRVIPAFLPWRPSGSEVPEEAISGERLRADMVLVSSGYGTAVYDYETVIAAAELTLKRTGRRLGLIIATYTTWDPDYWPQIERRSASATVKVSLLKNLTPDQFARVLQGADVYVRATTLDGDSVAVREAAAAGIRVLASDGAPRPEGVALFPVGQAEPLADLLEALLSDSSFGRPNTEVFKDTFSEVLKSYGFELQPCHLSNSKSL